MVSKKDATEKQVVPPEAYSRRGRKALLPDAPCGPRKWAGRAVLGFAGRPTETGARGRVHPPPYLGTSYRRLPVDLVAKATASSRPHAPTATVAYSAPPVSGSLAAPEERDKPPFLERAASPKYAYSPGSEYWAPPTSSPPDPASEATPGGEPVAAAQ